MKQCAMEPFGEEETPLTAAISNDEHCKSLCLYVIIYQQKQLAIQVIIEEAANGVFLIWS